MPHPTLAALLLVPALAMAGEAPPAATPPAPVAPAPPAAPTASPINAPAAPAAAPAPAADPAKPAEAAAEAAGAAPAPEPDPTAGVVAEGRFLYRQRDLDALMLVTARHLKQQKLDKAEEEQLRQALVEALTAREPLLAALALMPARVQGKARDQVVLDLLDYRAEQAPRPTEPAAAAPAAATTPPTDAGSAPAVAPAAPAAPAPAAAPEGSGPLLVRLPPLVRTRTLDGLGRRTMTLGLALYFEDPALAKRLEGQAPLIQDAVLGYIEAMPPAEFAEPTQAALKQGLVRAILAKVPEFPVNGVLIPQLDVTSADPAANK